MTSANINLQSTKKGECYMVRKTLASTALDHLKTCGAKTYLTNQIGSDRYTKNSDSAKKLTVAMKEVINSVLVDEETFSETKLDELLEDHLYLGKYHKNSVVKTLNTYIKRFLKWDELMVKEVIEGTGYDLVEISDELSLTVSWDIIFK